MTCSKKRKEWLVYVLVFLFSAGLYVLLLLIDKAMPFGSRSFLYDDAYIQYDNMFRTLIEFIHSPDKSMFMWNKGLGTDFYLNAIYYMLSPFNLIGILMGENNVPLALTVTIILKCSLISVAGVYYFRNTVYNPYSRIRKCNENNITNTGDEKNNTGDKKTNTGDEKTNTGATKKYVSKCGQEIIPVVFGLALGFCGYIMAYGHHVIWLDGLMLMPVLAIAIEKLNYHRAVVSYTLILAFIMVVNFYYAVYVCLFAVFYFLLLGRKSIREFARCGCRFAICSVVSAMLAGFVLVPAYVSISNAGDSMLGFDTPGNNVWGSITGYINSFFPVNEIQTGYLYSNNNYCGSIAIVLLGMFFMCSYISRKDKLRYILELAVLVLASNFLYLNFVFHGFALPHGMGNRFAVILTFVVLNAAFRVMIEYEKLRLKDVACGIVSAVVLLAVVLLFNDSLERPVGYLIYIMVVFLSGTAFVLYKRNSIKNVALVGIVCILWVGEIIADTLMTMPDITRDESLQQYILLDEWKDVYDTLPLKAGERKTALVNESYTPASDTDWYSSMINGYMADGYAAMGLAHFDNVQCIYYGTTPLTALMYNVRYILTNEENVNGGYHMVDVSGAEDDSDGSDVDGVENDRDGSDVNGAEDNRDGSDVDGAEDDRDGSDVDSAEDARNGSDVDGAEDDRDRSDFVVYEADELAGMGFMVDDDIINWSCDGTPADNQNEFVKLASYQNTGDGDRNGFTEAGDGNRGDFTETGNGDRNGFTEAGDGDRELFVELGQDELQDLQVSCNSCEMTQTGEGIYEYTTDTTFTPNIVYDFVAHKDMDLYIYSTDTREQSVMVKVDKKTVAESKYFSSGNFVHGGTIKKGQSVRVILYGGAPLGETAEKTVRFYDFNSELWTGIQSAFTAQTLEFDGYSGDTFRGHIDVSAPGVLYLAFPYNEGFTIRVDGEPAEKLLLGKGNMGVRLDTGSHDIEISYHTPGTLTGIILSGVGIILFACMAWTYRKRGAC